MTPERYRQVKSILDAALESGPAEQAAYLENVCGGDAELKAEVLSLIGHDREAAAFLEKPAVSEAEASSRLAPGARIGPYEIVGPLGAGAMGEVYRARDPRFGREVAIKFLPPSLARDPDRVSRFEREARAAGSLNHPNILTVHDFGREGGAPYLVSELLHGETLRLLTERGPLAPRVAVGYAAQIAHGLSEAHRNGVVHRDLKPENLIVSQDGNVKILDFGLAKLPDLPLAESGAARGRTEPGLVMGSPGYLSPEQVRGEPAGPASDIFSLGVILSEMLSGKRPFGGDTWVDELNAILRHEPPDLPLSLPGISDPADLGRAIKRCLVKNPAGRFSSATELAANLESLLEQPVPRASRSQRFVVSLAAAALILTVAYFALTARRAAPPPDSQRLTFRAGTVSAARFAEHGEVVVYSAAWDSSEFQVYGTGAGNPEVKPPPIAQAMLFAVSKRGDLALCTPKTVTQHVAAGELKRAQPDGSGQSTQADDVTAADFSPDGQLAVARLQQGGRSLIEYPIGEELFHSNGYIDALRVSPTGDLIAFLEHPHPDDARGKVAVIDRTKKYWSNAKEFNSMRGLAWSPDGRDVWFAAAEERLDMKLWTARARGGKPRAMYAFSSYISLEDILPDGRALITTHTLSDAMIFVGRAGKPQNLPRGTQSQAGALSRDGESVLLSESSGTASQDYETYFRDTGGLTEARKLGVGRPLSLSPDESSALAYRAEGAIHLELLPNPTGEPRPIHTGDIDPIGAAWLPDGKGFVFAGPSKTESLRYYVQWKEDAAPRPITGTDVQYKSISPIVVEPGGRSVAVVGSDQLIRIYPIESGAYRVVPGLGPGYTPLQWCKDDKLVVHRYGGQPPRLATVETTTGKLEDWAQLNPPNQVGLLDITPIRVSADCNSYAFSPLNVSSELRLYDKLR